MWSKINWSSLYLKSENQKSTNGVVNCFESIWPDQSIADLMEWDIAFLTVVDKINSWNKVANLKWLTYWNNDARDHLAPALGLHNFENTRLDDVDKSVGKVRSA